MTMVPSCLSHGRSLTHAYMIWKWNFICCLRLLCDTLSYFLSLQPCISAVGLHWHKEHFRCSRCNADLSTGKRRPDLISPCLDLTVWLSLSLPPFFFLSFFFSQGEGFNMENNMLFCADCFGAVYGATCFGCGQKIGGDELWVEALEHQWHSNCFRCEVRVQTC